MSDSVLEQVKVAKSKNEQKMVENRQKLIPSYLENEFSSQEMQRNLNLD